MKKYPILSGLIALSLFIISWGFKGHQAVATIAENHLTPKAKAAITELLAGQNIADIASWADEVRNQPAYKQTGSWHYINAELGLSYDQFSAVVKSQGENNVYGAILKYEAVLKSPSTTKEQQTEALKFIVHFIGDAHQPFHVSRAEDKGGNTIQVQFDGKGTNLHALWDSKLIDHEGLTSQQMAKDYDSASPEEIKKWQSESPMQWVWESYQLSSKFYAEIDKGNRLDDTYYQEHIGIIHERIEQAGIRLAGVLNDCFSGNTGSTVSVIVDTVPFKASPYYVHVDSKDIPKHIGQNVSTTGVVASTRLIESNNMTLLNVGAASPNQDFTIMIKSENRTKFGQPEIDLKGKMITVKGLVIDYRGQPEIEVTDPKELTY
jgi:hypothetical protein